LQHFQLPFDPPYFVLQFLQPRLLLPDDFVKVSHVASPRNTH
jgi:hypothetical protein